MARIVSDQPTLELGVRSPSSYLYLLWALAIGLACAAAAAATDNFASKLPAPIAERGFRATGGFQEEVNVFSGSVNLGIPLASIPLDGGSEFSLTLYYDSHLWKVGTLPTLSGEDVRTSVLGQRPFDARRDLTRRPVAWDWNVAPGWLLNPGRMLEVDPPRDGVRYTYLAPDHSRIPLYDRLHPDDPLDPDTYYSQDGSYLKFTRLERSDPFYDWLGSGYLYHPNGIKTRFEGGAFAYVEDPHGNRVVRTLIPGSNRDDAEQGVFFGPIEEYRDEHYGRTIRLGYAPNWMNCHSGPCLNVRMGMVDWVEYQTTDSGAELARIELELLPRFEVPGDGGPVPPAFCDNTDPSYDLKLCHRFWAEQGRQVPWLRHLAAIAPDLTPCGELPLDCFGILDKGTLFALNLHDSALSAVRLPDGTAYEFTYGSMSEVDGGPPGMLSGAVSEVSLPTGGRILYSYGEFRVPDNRRLDLRFSDSFDGPHYYAAQMGVIRRERLDVGGASLGVWEYRRGTLGAENFGNDNYLGPVDEERRDRDMYVVITSPRGDDTVHYFRTPEKAWDYGGSFTRFGAIGDAFPGLASDDTRQAYLAQERFDGPAVVGSGRGERLRSRYVAFVRDKRLDDSPESRFNRRLKYNREVFHDDLVSGVPRYRDVLYTDFDGLGHWRTVTTGGNFGNGDIVSTFTNYNSAARRYSTYESPAGGEGAESFEYSDHHNYDKTARLAPWRLETYTEQTRTEGTEVARTDFAFSAQTGALERARVRASLTGAAAANDLLTAFTYDSFGNRTSETTYGGDLANDLPTITPLPLIELETLTPEYRTERRYDYSNVIVETFEQEPQSNTNLLRTERLELDRHTGLTLKRLGPDDVSTELAYDLLNREVRRKLEDDAEITTRYDVATTSRGPLVTVRYGGKPREQTSQSGFGVVVGEATLFPSEGWSSVLTEYEHDSVSRISNPSFGQVGRTYTDFLDYDPFGRPKKVRTADGKSTFFDYAGDRLKTITRSIATGENGAETDISRIEEYDGQGRLIAVREPSNPNGTTLETSYKWDVNGRLVEVAQGVQLRTFVWDNRGFLLQESHPEIGLTGSGTLRYEEYDTRGLARERTIDEGPAIRSVYDRLGRITQVWDAGKNRLLKEFYYSPTNDGLNRRRSKVVQQKSHNWLPDPQTGLDTDLVITDDFTYLGRSGRLSSIRTRSNRGLSMARTFTYNRFGEVRWVDYPVCDRPPCGSGVGPSRRVTHSYLNDRGFLTALADSLAGPLLTDIDYHASGLVAGRSHDNGVVETRPLDPSGMPRPGSISFSGGGLEWTSGSFAYDGAQNIKAIGSDRFTYDGVSRLTQADVDFPSGTKRQLITYDAVGNILTLNTATDSEPITVDPQTNRLIMPGTEYDAAGNLTAWRGLAYHFDALDRMRTLNGLGVNRHFVYDADDRRVMIIDNMSGETTWSIRDEAGRAMRELTVSSAGPSWSRDFVYGGESLLAAMAPDTTVHHHRDHLGSLRFATDHDTGDVVSEYHYYPFGELGHASGDEERLFTGHQRDFNCEDVCTASDQSLDDLDYMLARYYSPQLARFLSRDPVEGSVDEPQSWNRYVYSLNNPVKLLDPDGRLPISAFDFLFEYHVTVTAEYPPLGEGLFDAVAADATAILLSEMRRHAENREEILGILEPHGLTLDEAGNIVPDPSRPHPGPFMTSAEESHRHGLRLFELNSSFRWFWMRKAEHYDIRIASPLEVEQSYLTLRELSAKKQRKGQPGAINKNDPLMATQWLLRGVDLLVKPEFIRKTIERIERDRQNRSNIRRSRGR